MIYLAGPIDRVSPNDASAWRKFATGKLNATCFDPYAAFGGVHQPKDPAVIQAINVAAMKSSKLLLVNGSIPGGKVTWDEVDWALDHDVPVVIYSAGCRYEELKTRGALVFDSLGDAIVKANEIHAANSVEWPAISEEDLTESYRRTVFPATPEAAAGLDPIIGFMVDTEACELWQPDVPTLAYAGDVGYDLPCSESIVLHPGVTTQVRLAFRIEPPPGHWWELTGRSSTWRNLQLQVERGVIDEGYRGPLWAGIHNPTKDPVMIAQGDKLVQCILHKSAPSRSVLVGKLTPTQRNTQGFGSSGR